ncbi:hypothetical protein Lal_00014366 [Lupinus albus]|nr:hypothetical protein Lal_00014366 [Lupinus albus]
MFRLPTTATAPFCPSEVRGTVAVPPGLPLWKKLLRFAGPGLLVSVGYMDPGNWATDIEAGSRYGYALLFVVGLSSLAAMVLQCLSARLGIVTGMDLARASRNRYQPGPLRVQWLMAELSIIACDLAEVLGCALAFHLLLGVPILWGVALTALDTLIVLGLKGKNFRQLEAIVLGLILTIGLADALVAGREPARAAVPGDRHPGRDGDAAQPVPAFIHRADPHDGQHRSRQARGHRPVAAGHHRVAGAGAARERCNPDPGRSGIQRARPPERGRHRGCLPPAGAHRRDGAGRAAVWHRVAGGGAKLDLYRHHRGANPDGGLPRFAHALLAAAVDHAGAGADPGVHWRGDAGRPRHRQTACHQSGGTRPAVAVCDVSADPHDRRSHLDGRLC